MNLSEINQLKQEVYALWYNETDEAKKAELAEKLQKEIGPTAMVQLEAILLKNGGQFMVGKEVRFCRFN